MRRRAFLLSVYYDKNENRVVMRFYDPEKREIFNIKDMTGHKPYLLTDAPEGEIREAAGPALAPRIEGASQVEMWDPLTLRRVRLLKVEAADPLAIGGSPVSLRERLRKSGWGAWEARIRYYMSYIYDTGIVPGLPYEVEGSGRIRPVDLETPDLSGVPKSDETTAGIIERYARLLESPVPEMSRGAVDIEVSTPVGHVPDPREPKRPVIAVAIVGDGLREVHVLKRGSQPEEVDGARVAVHETEVDLLREVFDRISSLPVVFTFNGDGFDLPYLAARAEFLGIKRHPVIVERNRSLLRTGVHIDLYKLYGNRSVQVYVFGNRYLGHTLDEISKAMLGEGKVELPSEDLGSLDAGLLARYCLKDAELTYRLGTAIGDKLLKLLFVFARISRLPLEDVSREGISQWIQSMIYAEYRSRRWLIPNPEDVLRVRGAETYSSAAIRGKKYAGAIVLEPVPGAHFDVAVMDFASLYPSIIERWRVSFETINCPHDECRSNRPVETLPHWICKRREVGLVHRLIGGLRDLRVYRYKRLSRDESIPEEERSWYGVIQSSLKVMLNASYGVFGYEKFPLYSPPVAEMIAALGRKAIKTSLEIAREMGLRVIYGDTDSLFIEGADLDELESFEEIVEDRLGIDIELDKHYRYVILSSLKKNYLGVRDDGTVDIKGLLGKKRNVPEIVRRAFSEVIDELRAVHTPDDLDRAIENIKNVISRYVSRLEDRRFDMGEVSFRVVMTKPISSYVKTTPQHVKAARMIKEATGIEPLPGEVIEYVKTTGKDGVKPLALARPEDVDVRKYLEIMRSTFEQVLDVLGLDFDELSGRGKGRVSLEGYL